MMVFYNEIDPFAAEWLRQLIGGGHIADGIVDERSIVEIEPDELKQYTQCHFFAGIGGWSYALRLAGVPDDLPVWTGSCPCQPFSSAGKQRAADDERHLWPAFFRLIRECRPGIVFGEQVAGHAGYAWWDAVATDLESEGYAVAAADLGAHSVGAPHIRQRLYWVADADTRRGQSRDALRKPGDDLNGRGVGWLADAREAGREQFSAHDNRSAEVAVGRSSGIGAHDAGRSAHGGLDNNNTGLEGRQRSGNVELHGGEGSVRPIAEAGFSGGVADAESERQRADQSKRDRCDRQFMAGTEQGCDGGNDSAVDRPSPTHGFWRDADWLFCRDGKWRPVEPGTFPLAYGLSARVGRLRGYGNAIVPQVAACFVETVMEGA